MSEAKGPFFDALLTGQGFMKDGKHLLSEEIYKTEEEQKSYCAGFSAGRASRDGLRKALEAIVCLASVETADDVEIAVKALEADGEVGK
jgi:hypothetical protein